MADGSRVDPGDDDAERTALAEEARLIHRTRRRLVAWSGVSTLLVLVVLGAAMYAGTALLIGLISWSDLDAVRSALRRSHRDAPRATLPARI